MLRAVVLSSLLALVTACGSSSSNPSPDGGSPDATPGLPDAGPPPPAHDPARFSIVAIPDTQYLFDQDRGNHDVLAASLHWIVEHREQYHIVFTATLGDIVENHGEDELADAADTYAI